MRRGPGKIDLLIIDGAAMISRAAMPETPLCRFYDNDGRQYWRRGRFIGLYIRWALKSSHLA